MKIAFLNDGAYGYAAGAPAAVGGSERDQWLLGTSLAASSVKAGSMGTVWLTDESGKNAHMNDDGIESITDANGVDWTERVLKEGKRVPPK